MTSSMVQQQSLPSDVHAHGRTDEDFINRSLLNQIDTDADTDPVFSSDSEAAGASFRSAGMHGGRDYGSSSSQSSVESSAFPYQMMQARSQVPPRGDSPNGQRGSLVYSSQNDQMIHTPQQMLYNNPGAEQPSEFGHFPSNDNQAFDSATLRSNSMYNTFGPSRGRQGVPGSSSSGMVNDNNSNFGQFSGDVFGSLASSQQQQQLPNGMRGYDFMNEGPSLKTGGAKSNNMFNIDPFGNNPMMQSQQMNKQMQSQAQHLQLHNLVNQPFGNNMMQGSQQAQSQTPFGPHVNSANNGNTLTHANGMGTVSVTNQQEEISTIFVVGFPEDMQEREFQNMFTFSSGFEAATLKIPNKDSTSYNVNASSNQANNQARGGAFQLGYPFSGGANDPYNLLTVNQGGVVVDSRDGTTASWPAIDTNDMGPGNNGQGNQGPPRKQIIGFAKFRTRAEALAARDLLQGRRVDIEKGAVLKAEMAKKNLHTKRGVGPLGGPLSVNVGGQQQGSSASGSGTASAAGGQGVNGSASMNMNSIADNLSAITGMLSPSAMNAPDMLGSRDLTALGMGGLSRRDRGETIEDERETRRRMSAVNVLTNGLGGMNLHGQRGPRERLEEEEREREKRRKEREADRTPLRTNPAFDAFHSAGLNQRNQPLSASILSPSESLSAFPFAGASLFSPHESIGSSLDGWPISTSQSQQQKFQSRGSIAAMPLGISTNITKLQPSSSMESSPTEASAPQGPMSLGQGQSSEMPNQVSAGAQDPELFSPKTSVPLTSHPSMSSLGSCSRPYSPTTDIAAPSASSSYAHALPEQFAQAHASRAQAKQANPPSSASSISESRSSSSSMDDEVSRTIDVGTTQRGAMSPQLPSPNSGGSSGGSRTNLSDQNPPINTLYVGNLPTSPVPGNAPTLLEDGLRSLFQRCPGYRKLVFRQKSNGPMCFVEFDDVNFAAKAISELYGQTLNGLVKGGIRLSYSKNPLGVRTPTNTANGAHQSFNTGSFSSLQEAFSRQNSSNILSIDTSLRSAISRRDPSEVTSPSQYFAASPPPPRFFGGSPPPSSGFGHAGLGRGSQGFTGSFSPFGTSTPPEMPQQQQGVVGVAQENHELFSPTVDHSTTPNLENARGG